METIPLTRINMETVRFPEINVKFGGINKNG